jgi:putative flippase GtrA
MSTEFKKTFLVFIAVGLFVALFQYVTFYCFAAFLKFDYIIASSISFILTIVVSFFLQKNVTFNNADEHGRSRKTHVLFILFILNALWGLLLNVCIMFVGTNILRISPYMTQIISMVILASYNFFVYRVLLG